MAVETEIRSFYILARFLLSKCFPKDLAIAWSDFLNLISEMSWLYTVEFYLFYFDLLTNIVSTAVKSLMIC